MTTTPTTTTGETVIYTLRDEQDRSVLVGLNRRMMEAAQAFHAEEFGKVYLLVREVVSR